MKGDERMLHEHGVRVGINGGSGRIGGNLIRTMILHPNLFNMRAINDTGLDPANPALNFKQCKAYDSTFGPWPCDMEVDPKDKNVLLLYTHHGEHRVRIFSERDPAKIPWGTMGVEGVAECTGVFRSRKTDQKPGYDSHLDAGAKCVALSAPAADKLLTIVYGVHTTPLRGVPLVSCASCTSGSIAFPLRVLLDNKVDWGFTAGTIETVHAYTMGEQGLQDRPDHIKPGTRRMFSGTQNIIPTTTGAAKAIPQVDGIGSDMQGIAFDGFALRVPVASGSLTLLKVILEKRPPLATVLDAMRVAAKRRFPEMFAVNESPVTDQSGLPLVSSHIVQRSESSILDAEFCSAIGAMYTLPLWYGNEWGYVWRLAETLYEQCVASAARP